MQVLPNNNNDVVFFNRNIRTKGKILFIINQPFLRKVIVYLNLTDTWRLGRSNI